MRMQRWTSHFGLGWSSVLGLLISLIVVVRVVVSAVPPVTSESDTCRGRGGIWSIATEANTWTRWTRSQSWRRLFVSLYAIAVRSAVTWRSRRKGVVLISVMKNLERRWIGSSIPTG